MTLIILSVKVAFIVANGVIVPSIRITFWGLGRWRKTWWHEQLKFIRKKNNGFCMFIYSEENRKMLYLRSMKTISNGFDSSLRASVWGQWVSAWKRFVYIYIYIYPSIWIYIVSYTIESLDFFPRSAIQPWQIPVFVLYLESVPEFE